MVIKCSIYTEYSNCISGLSSKTGCEPKNVGALFARIKQEK